MMKTPIKIKDDQRGTALLVALLIMGVFIAVSLALSTLVLRELRVTGEAISSGKAYYAAEAGVEEALYFLKNELPGWEEGSDNESEISANAKFKYTVNNRCESYPCIDPAAYDFVSTGGDDFRGFYDVLDLNENVTIPLFVVGENASGDTEVTALKDFTVEYYANFDPSKDLRFDNTGYRLEGWDVLRWKVFGMVNVDDEYKTESINDFTAVSTVKNLDTGDDFVTSSKQPSWFGTKSCADYELSNPDRPEIECLSYAIKQRTSLKGNACSNLQARDYYRYTDDGEVFFVEPCHNIATFMSEHQPVTTVGANGATGLNYLSLTNLMNPAMIKDEISGGSVNLERRKRMSQIFFRVESDKDAEFVREYAEINSDGYSDGIEQSINVYIKRDSYMPVFNFSLYSTYESGASKPYYE